MPNTQNMKIGPPADTPPFAYPAWAAALSAAARSPEAVEAFVIETGCTYRPSGTLIGDMIDDATGRTDELGEQFVSWFNRSVWGAWQ